MPIAWAFWSASPGRRKYQAAQPAASGFSARYFTVNAFELSSFNGGGQSGGTSAWSNRENSERLFRSATASSGAADLNCSLRVLSRIDSIEFIQCDLVGEQRKSPAGAITPNRFDPASGTGLLP